MPSKKSGFTALWNNAIWNNAMHAFATPRGRITLVALVCVVAAGILMAARPPSPSVEVTAVEFQPQDVDVAAAAPGPRKRGAPAASRQATSTTTARTRTAATAAAPKTDGAKAATANAAPSRSSEAVVASNGPASESAPRAGVVESGARTARAEASSAPAQAGSAVSITGCLERDEDKFHLKDADGENAPRSRSWKSGFLRRSTASIDVTDPANRLRLANHVGHRVTVSGMLVDREMRARSLQMIANDCDN